MKKRNIETFIPIYGFVLKVYSVLADASAAVYISMDNVL